MTFMPAGAMVLCCRGDGVRCAGSGDGAQWCEQL
jgi:hypothetical protein